MSKKTSIFKTAECLFASQGYGATATLQIAKEVGVTEPAVFYHFKSKNAFFLTVLEAAAQTYLSRIDSITLNYQKTFNVIEALIRIYFAIVAEEPDLFCASC